MWHKLALHLGGTVAELQSRMSSSEFAQWVAYFRIEPGLIDRQDAWFAMLAMTMANLWRSKSSKVYKLNDFMLFSNRQLTTSKRRPKTKKELTAMWNMIKAVFGDKK